MMRLVWLSFMSTRRGWGIVWIIYPPARETEWINANHTLVSTYIVSCLDFEEEVLCSQRYLHVYIISICRCNCRCDRNTGSGSYWKTGGISVGFHFTWLWVWRNNQGTDQVVFFSVGCELSNMPPISLPKCKFHIWNTMHSFYHNAPQAETPPIGVYTPTFLRYFQYFHFFTQ